MNYNTEFKLPRSYPIKFFKFSYALRFDAPCLARVCAISFLSIALISVGLTTDRKPFHNQFQENCKRVLRADRPLR